MLTRLLAVGLQLVKQPRVIAEVSTLTHHYTPQVQARAEAFVPLYVLCVYGAGDRWDLAGPVVLWGTGAWLCLDRLPQVVSAHAHTSGQPGPRAVPLPRGHRARPTDHGTRPA